MIELLQAAARRDATAPAVITDDRTFAYAELADQAAAIAAGLAARGIRRFGIVHQDAAAVIALLAGASLAGAEPCLYPPLDNEDVATDCAARFDHEIVISDGLEQTTRFEVLSLNDITAADQHPPATPPADRPLLVLTTGTTGTPRGVRHDWSRVLRSVRHAESGSGQRWLLAYGVHQFAGLQILVHVAAAGATLVAPVPRRPRQGLAAMRTHAVDCASATPTFWRFLLAEMRSDGGPVPELRQITLGGEAVPAPLLEQISSTFSQARISQIYAANEFGPSGSVRDGRSGLPVSLLERGDDADIAFKVLDGELWVRSRVGMVGYYGESPVDDPDGWRPTGDVVDIEGDRILFRGRSSEVINVGGVKVHPLPIEERVGGLPGVTLARAYGRPNPLTGAIVALEVVPDADVDTESLDAEIRTACVDLPAAARPRSIRFVEAIATTGHKVQRRSSNAG